MHTRVIVLLFILVPVGCLPAAAATPEEIATRFFETLLKGNSAGAVDQFFGSSPVVKEKAQQLQLLKSQIAAISQLYGAPFAVELFLVEDLTPSVQRRVYVTKHTSHPVGWEMYFYKPKTVWLPDQLLFTDQYQVLVRKK